MNTATFSIYVHLEISLFHTGLKSPNFYGRLIFRLLLTGLLAVAASTQFIILSNDSYIDTAELGRISG
jgi:hypothetical protein